MRILVLGATGFVGQAIVAAAASKGHSISAFAAEPFPTDPPAGVEVVLGDRDGSLDAIAGSMWDSVIDVATYGPAWVRTLSETLGAKVAHYSYISSINVYACFNDVRGNDELGATQIYSGSSDPYTPIARENEHYGALKRLCEAEAERQFQGRALIVRPGYLVGPGEDPPWLCYWAERVRNAGEVLVPGDGSDPVQWLDVRDLASWLMDLIGRHETGVFNAVGPMTRFADLISGLKAAAVSDCMPTWVPSWFLVQQGVGPVKDLPFWLPTEYAGFMRTSNVKATSRGLAFRPIGKTAADALAWREMYGPGPRERSGRMKIGWLRGRELAVLAAWRSLQR